MSAVTVGLLLALLTASGWPILAQTLDLGQVIRSVEDHRYAVAKDGGEQ